MEARRGWGRKQAGRRSSCSQDNAQWGRTAREEIGELIRRTEGSRSPTVWWSAAARGREATVVINFTLARAARLAGHSQTRPVSSRPTPRHDHLLTRHLSSHHFTRALPLTRNTLADWLIWRGLIELCVSGEGGGRGGGGWFIVRVSW